MSTVWIDPAVSVHNLTEPLRTYLEALDHERPIRVLRGTGRQYPVEVVRENWNAEQAHGNHDGEGEADPDTLSHARDNGITIILYGSLGHAYSYGEVAVDYDEMFDPPQTDRDFQPLYDVIQVQPEDMVGEPMFQGSDGNYWLEVEDRVIASHAPIYQLARGQYLNFSHLFDQALAMCVDPQLHEGREARRAEEARQRFLTIVQERDGSEVRGIRTRIHQAETNLVQTQATIESERRMLREQQELLDGILARRASGGLDENSLMAEWDGLLRNVHVLSARWRSPTCLAVRTDDITLTRPDTNQSCIVGRFNIEFDFDNGSVRVHNLTNRRGHYDHPHVNNGSFCAGEMTPTLQRLMSRREISTAVNLAIAALEHVEPNDDYGRHVEWWFEGDDAPAPTVTDEADENG